MASKNSALIAVFFTLNFFFVTLNALDECGCNTIDITEPVPSPLVPSPTVPSPLVPSPTVPSPLVPSPLVPSPLVPSPLVPSPSIPSSVFPSPSTPGSSEKCPIDAIRLGVCANVLRSTLLNLELGQSRTKPCCSVIQGLVDLEASVCICIALKANVLGINLNIPISLTLLLDVCNRNFPLGFQCG